MVAIKRIGLATDFSKVSKHAEEITQTLRTALNAELSVIHVFYKSDIRIPEPYYFMPGVDQWVSTREEEMMVFGKESIAKLADEMGDAKGIFLEGKPGPKLVKFAERAELDLLIMGTHGYRGFNRFMLGSVAEYVLRHAPCPVLTVKFQDDENDQD